MAKQKHNLWYKDAIIYQLHVQSFFDSNGDGRGDFKGLLQKLDYIKDLGVTALWILPFYPSPLRDGGYDISDFTGIHSSYGSMSDFKRFIREAHKRDLRVITELVLNHTSNQHQWFQRARNSKKGSRYRDFYVWSDSPEKYSDARIIFQDFETSNWAWDPVAKSYYWHRFYSHQPDLNFDNPSVQKAVFRILDFWFNIGVDGLRLDAVPYLYEREGTNCENLPETHNFLKKLRNHIDEKHDDKMLLAEANQWPEDSSAYFGDGDECHMAFNFPLMPRLYMGMKMEDRFPIVDIMEQMPKIPDSSQWAIFLRNHDELTLEMVTDEERDYMYKSFAKDPKQRINLGIRRRLAPLLDNDQRKIEMMNMLLFSLPGTPIVYYGDEIGMGDNFYLGDRDGVRTPMQWSSNKNSGFSESDPQKLYLPLIINHEYHYEGLNVENQERNESSLLWWMRRIIAKRKNYKAFSRGSIKFLNSGNPKTLAFIREYEEEKILVLINLSRYSQVAKLDLHEYKDYIPVEAFSQNEFPVIEDSEYTFPMQRKDYFWFELHKPEESRIDEIEGIHHHIKLQRDDWNKVTPQLEKELNTTLLNYVKKSRWFRGKAKKVKDVQIVDVFPLNNAEYNSHILMINIEYIASKPEMYIFPVSAGFENTATDIAREYPQAVITNVEFEHAQGILYDGAFDKDLHSKILDLIVSKGRIKGRSGTISGVPGKKLSQFVKKRELPMPSQIVGAEQSNTSILYDNKLFFKIYRNPEEGHNPEIEILKALTEKTRFKNLPPYAGALEYHKPDTEAISLGTLVSFIPNEGNAWEFTQSSIDQFYSHIISEKDELPDPPSYHPSLLDSYEEDDQEKLERLIGPFFLEMVDLLGQRTGEMHRAMIDVKSLSEFQPEAFSVLYQKSLNQSFRTLIKRTFDNLKTNQKNVSKQNSNLIDHVLSNENELLNRIKDALETEKIRSLKSRIHGDYHLGQVLFTGKDFIIIDFEGEPIRSLSSRKLKFCPFRDVAGMLRSFHYAIYMGLLSHEEMYPGSSEYLEQWVEPWYNTVSHRFLQAYLKASDDAHFIPEERSQIETLIRLFVIEKAVYEADYEINNRPDWINIPLNGLRIILDDLVSE